MIETEPLIRWPEPFVQYAGFAASFLASGAIGFRYAVLGRRRGASAGTADPVERGVLEMAARGAAALASAAVLAIFGVITAWRHLKLLAALWTTPYGAALIVKLCVVVVVVGLGAWNWCRQRPRMGTEVGALALQRSARVELAAVAIVLAVTAILVSLPSPKPPVP